MLRLKEWRLQQRRYRSAREGAEGVGGLAEKFGIADEAHVGSGREQEAGQLNGSSRPKSLILLRRCSLLGEGTGRDVLVRAMQGKNVRPRVLMLTDSRSHPRAVQADEKADQKEGQQATHRLHDNVRAPQLTSRWVISRPLQLRPYKDSVAAY